METASDPSSPGSTHKKLRICSRAPGEAGTIQPVNPAIGDLAEDHGGADFLLATVVGRRHAAVGEKDEELAPPRLDLALQLASGRMGGGASDQGIEAPLGLGGVG